MRSSPWKISEYKRWALCWDQYSWVSAIPVNWHLCTEITKRRTILHTTVCNSFLFFDNFVKRKAENTWPLLRQFLVIFHKSEDQLSCLTCLNLNWVKSYGWLWLRYFFNTWKCMISGVVCEMSFSHLRTKSALKFLKWHKQRLNIPNL